MVEFSRALEGAGVAAIAVNTDRKFFGCSYEDLTSIRVSAPLSCGKTGETRPMNCVVELFFCVSLGNDGAFGSCWRSQLSTKFPRRVGLP